MKYFLIEKNIKYELKKLKNKDLYSFNNKDNKLIYIEMKKLNRYYKNYNKFYDKYTLLRYNIKLLEIDYYNNKITYYLYKKKFSNNKKYETLNLNDIKYIKIYEK